MNVRKDRIEVAVAPSDEASRLVWHEPKLIDLQTRDTAGKIPSVSEISAFGAS